MSIERDLDEIFVASDHLRDHLRPFERHIKALLGKPLGALSLGERVRVADFIVQIKKQGDMTGHDATGLEST